IREGARVGRTPLRPLALQKSRVAEDVALLEVVTADAIITCLRHGADEPFTTLFVGGALRGLSGPAGGLYHRLASTLGGVRIHYRKPGHMEDCLMDVLLVHHLLQRRGVERVVVVGHSFGGAVAVGAGALLGKAAAGVVALSTQVPGTELVDRLAGTPILLIHGEDDGVLPDLCSRNVYERAGDPKELVLLPGEGPPLEHSGPELVDRLTTFILDARG